VIDSRSTAFRVARLALISALAKGPGFLIPVIIAAFFGAGHTTDAYFLAYGGVLLVGGTVGQPLEAAVAPFAAHALALGRIAARRFMKSLGARVTAIGFGSAAVGALLIASGLFLSTPHGVSSKEVFAFYLLLVPGAVAWCLAGLYSGSLVPAWRLEASALGYAFRGVGAVTAALVGVMMHRLWPLAVGVSVGEWARVLWLRRQWSRAISRLADGESGEPDRGFISAAAHQMAAQGMVSAAQFFERFLVGTVALAAISRVEYANRLVMVAAVVFDGGVGPWLLATWSNARVLTGLRSDWQAVYRPIVLAVVAAAGMASIMAFGAPLIVSLILHHGAFTDADSSLVTQLLRWYALGYFFNMSALCVERLLLARAQNRTFAALCAVRATVRLATIVLLLRRAGILALPIGYLAAEVLYFCSLLAVSRRESTLRVSASHA
jgi:peptidoglycan biosynthesis protein MviN/MurJ (putative lipid II flippase)